MSSYEVVYFRVTSPTLKQLCGLFDKTNKIYVGIGSAEAMFAVKRLFES